MSQPDNVTATMKPRREAVGQFLRFLVVGVLNTAVTLVVILVLKSLLGINPWVANAAGYVAGLINSFLWNRIWVFHSSKSLRRQAVAFLVGFAVCYALQFGVTWSLAELTPLRNYLIATPLMTISGYGIATLAGMGAYTLANFCYNRMVAFK